MIPDQFRLIAMAIAAALLIYSGWCAQGWRMGEQMAQMETDQALALVAAQQQSRAKEKQWQDSLEETRNDAQQSIEVAEADAAAAAATADSLLQQLDRLKRRATNCASSANGSAPAQDATVVLADLLAEVEREGRAMATEATLRGIAGVACEKSYGVLR